MVSELLKSVRVSWDSTSYRVCDLARAGMLLEQRSSDSRGGLDGLPGSGDPEQADGSRGRRRRQEGALDRRKSP